MIENRFGNKVIYQLELRTFTPQGTLKAAEKLLPHLKETGFDIIYLCPVFSSDDDMNEAHWSERQRKSKCGNPKNSYRMKDYFDVDEEYGTKEDLRDFINTAHNLGLLVFLDLVYFHCGPNAVFLKDHPEFVKRDENGEILYGDLWPFPQINYDVPEVWDYLESNMVYYVTEFDVDGYRTDVGQLIPDDFWVRSIRRIKEIKPSIIMLNEGYVVDITVGETDRGVFDTNYNFSWDARLIEAMSGKCNAENLRAQWETDKEFYRGMLGKCVRNIDNHDIATDSFGNRHQNNWGNEGVECALVINHTLDGIPFIFNGYEVASSCEACMFANRFSKGENAIEWSNALLPEGKRRLELMKKLNAIHHGYEAIWRGDLRFVETDKKKEIFAFEREFDGKRVVVLANVSAKAVKVNAQVSVEGMECILSSRTQVGKITDEKLTVDMLAKGYAVFAEK